MAKFYGEVGFAETVETSPGVWVDRIVERNYYGDVLQILRRLQSTEYLNDDVIVSNEISIVSDPYANLNFQQIRYVIWMGTKWKVSTARVEFPRLILSLGGVWNG